jgi:acyl transferase domain-containing protein
MTRRAEPVAIVGIACRVPGADDPDGFAELLFAGRQQFTDVPAARILEYDPAWTGVPQVRAAVLERPDLFDALFFGIGPRMAAWMDPQMFHLLELTWRALESAAIAPASLAGTDTAVYVSTTSSDHKDRNSVEGRIDRYSFMSSLNTFFANRISFQYDLHGPSITIDTACAGGLTAVALAVGALRAGEADVAIAAGSNLLAHGYNHAVLMNMGAVSRTGTARPFDARADGYVRGEGVFVFVLKRLDDALADNDPIHAIVYGSAMNHDGKAGGLVRPDSRSQQRLLRRALDQAGAEIADIGYLEAHAAGAPVGDAIETATFRQMLQELPGGPPQRAAGPDGRLWLGSVKANIGHLEGAAGSASLMKAILALRYDAIPPTPGFEKLHEDINLDGVPLAVADQVVAWPRTVGRRLIGVDSFGVGGANAHVVIGDGPRRAAPPPRPAAGWLVPVSAQSPAALTQLAAELAEHLTGVGDDAVDFESVVRTLQHGRSHLRHRRIARADGVATLVRRLRDIAEGRADPDVLTPGEDADALAPALGAWLAGTADRWPDAASAPDVLRRPLTHYPFQWRSHWVREKPPAVPPPYTASRNPAAHSPS